MISLLSVAAAKYTLVPIAAAPCGPLAPAVAIVSTTVFEFVSMTEMFVLDAT